jgi:hypothetical protein
MRLKGHAEAAQAAHDEISRRTTKAKVTAPTSLLPSTPADLQTFFANQSVAQLKALLSQAELPVDQGALYKELKRRGE